jgi:hypothetical protein
MIWDLQSFIDILKDIFFPLILGGLFFFNVWQSSQYIMIQKSIQKTNLEKEELERRNEDLKISILTQTSVEKIDQIYSRTIQERIKTTQTNITTLKLPPSEIKVKGTKIAN